MNNYILHNGEALIDKELFLDNYGCVKVDFRENEGKLFYVYAFDNSLAEWDFNNGELILITEDQSLIDKLKKDILVIEVGDLFCKECFRKKDVNNLKNGDVEYWCYYFWDKTPENSRRRIQNEILFTFPEIDWSMTKYIFSTSDGPHIFYGICVNNCMSEKEYDNSPIIKKNKFFFKQIWKREIADEILNGTESFLEDYLCDHIETIEKGMKFLDRQVRMDTGIIDILAEDKNGVKCIIELKINEDDKSIVWQSAYYPTCFNEKVRMITIAPSYSDRVYRSLKNIKNIEIKVLTKNIGGSLKISDLNNDLKLSSNIKKSSQTNVQDVI